MSMVSEALFLKGNNYCFFDPVSDYVGILPDAKTPVAQLPHSAAFVAHLLSDCTQGAASNAS
jgi:hypothetical protein